MKSLVALLLIVFLISCNSNKKRQQETEKEMTKIIELVPFPDESKTALPHLFSNKEITLLSWVKTVNDSTNELKYSYLIEDKWEQPKKVITGKNWFVNWADFPSITENNGNLLTHFLKKSSEETFSYDVKLNLLTKGESQWKTQMPLHTDNTKTEHGFVTVLPYQGDSFFITWLDGRNTASSDGHEHTGHGGAMTIRAAEVSSSGTVSNDILLDAKTCDCCQTTAAITDNGPIVIYRGRTDEEIRDIAITRRINGQWTKPKFVHEDGWEINGCPVNGPKVDAIGNKVAVAWFTAVNGEPKVKVAFSDNAGADFARPILVSNTKPLGRVDLELLDSENAIVSWMETVADITYFKAMKINKSGTSSTPVIISTLDASRKTGFPQMELVEDKVYFAWTAIDNDVSSIKTAYLSLEEF